MLSKRRKKFAFGERTFRTKVKKSMKEEMVQRVSNITNSGFVANWNHPSLLLVGIAFIKTF